MGFGHLENSYRMVERRIEAIDEILDDLKMPLPGDASLTDESVEQIYLYKCQRLQMKYVLEQFDAEIQRRRVELEPGLRLFFSSPLWPKQ